MNEAEFVTVCRAEGWSEPRSVSYKKHERPKPHAHEFDAYLFLQSGSVTIAFSDGQQTLGPGDHCVVLAGQTHAENGGSKGGRGLLATRPPTS